MKQLRKALKHFLKKLFVVEELFMCQPLPRNPLKCMQPILKLKYCQKPYVASSETTTNYLACTRPWEGVHESNGCFARLPWKRCWHKKAVAPSISYQPAIWLSYRCQKHNHRYFWPDWYLFICFSWCLQCARPNKHKEERREVFVLPR